MKMKKTSSDASPSASNDGTPVHSSGSRRMANRPTPIRTINGASFTSVVRTESDVPYRTPRMFTAASPPKSRAKAAMRGTPRLERRSGERQRIHEHVRNRRVRERATADGVQRPCQKAGHRAKRLLDVGHHPTRSVIWLPSSAQQSSTHVMVSPQSR